MGSRSTDYELNGLAVKETVWSEFDNPVYEATEGELYNHKNGEVENQFAVFSETRENGTKSTQDFTPGSKLTFTEGRRCGFKRILLVIVLLLLLAGLAVGIYFIVHALTREKKVTKEASWNSIEGSIKCTDQSYTSELEKPNSSKYRSLASDIEYQLDLLFSNHSLYAEYVSSKVTGFSQGSVIVEFVLLFNKKYTEGEILNLVQTAFDDGLKFPSAGTALLGSYTVEKSSLELNALYKEPSNTSSSTSSSTSSTVSSTASTTPGARTTTPRQPAFTTPTKTRTTTGPNQIRTTKWSRFTTPGRLFSTTPWGGRPTTTILTQPTTTIIPPVITTRLPPPVCEPITATTCQNRDQVTYSTARFPNGAGHRSQAEATAGLAEYSALLSSGCHPYTTRFICASLFPRCESPAAYSVLCQSLCEEIFYKCTQYIPASLALLCQELPHTQCIGAPALPPILVRLVGGAGFWEGRVEVQYGGVWGTVCDDGFSADDAHVICRQLGFSGGKPRMKNYFLTGTGPTWLGSVQCTGEEMHLALCQFSDWNRTTCEYAREDAGVTCNTDVTVVTGIYARLVGGKSTSAGRVEIQYNNEWGTVCNDRVDPADVNVLCRMVGFTSGSRVDNIDTFGKGPEEQVIWLDEIDCLGNETNIGLCEHSGWGTHNCDHNEDLAIECSNAPVVPMTTDTTIPGVGPEGSTIPDIPDGTVRLGGGPDDMNGRVEIYHAGQWGTICRTFFDNNAATVVCRMLGYTGDSAYELSRYGEGDGVKWLDGVLCNGTEQRLDQCRHDPWGEAFCEQEAVSVSCSEEIPDLLVRLVDGRTNSSGRVEVLYNGTWGTICDDSFDDEDATVVCRMLDLSLPGIYEGTKHGPGTETMPIWLDGMDCEGSERSLAQCEHEGWSKSNCDHDEDVSISCGIPVTSAPPVVDLGADIFLFLPNNRITLYGNSSTSDIGIRSYSWDVFAQGKNIALSGEDTAFLVAENLEVGEYTFSLTVTDTDGQTTTGLIKVIVREAIPDITVELVDGPDSMNGRLEILYNGTRGTVCDDNFDDTAAQVVCNMLGYVDEPARMVDNLYGPGSGTIWLEEVSCTGAEKTLAECKHEGWNVHNCRHREDVSISCGMPLKDRVRLVEGISDLTGRIEIYANNTWGTICDDDFDDNDALVLCRMLGYNGSAVYESTTSLPGSGPIHLDDLECAGSEESIFRCPSSGVGITDCDHSEDVVITCIPPPEESTTVIPTTEAATTITTTTTTAATPILTVDAQLLGGLFGSEGRLEAKVDGIFGAVCLDGFDRNIAQVVCRQLGYSGDEAVLIDNYFPLEASVPTVLDDVSCAGDEANIGLCELGRTTSSSACPLEDYVAIRCAPIDLPYQFRLDGGRDRAEGIVQVKPVGAEWSNFCTTEFGILEAALVCQTLGYNETPEIVDLQTFNSTGTLVDNVSCVMSGLNGTNPEDLCATVPVCNQQVAVNCVPRRLRLADGEFENSGRIELFYNGTWGTICDDGFDEYDAYVVCTALGYNGSVEILNNVEPGSGMIWMEDLDCVGNEESVWTCPHTAQHNCNHYEDSGVACYYVPAVPTMLPMRLVGGSSLSEGRLEVMYNGTFGTICDDDFDSVDADVACVMLGFSANGAIIPNTFGEGTGPIWLEGLMCSGRERSLADCPHPGWGEHNCYHSEDVAIRCTEPGAVTDGTPESSTVRTTTTTPAPIGVRLVDGESDQEGIVEIFHNGVYGTICDENFDHVDAQVICRMLGYNGTARRLFRNTFWSSKPIWLSNITCIGNEESVLDCRHSEWNRTRCSHQQDVYITCDALDPPMRLVRGDNQGIDGQGRVEVFYNNQWGTVCDDGFDELEAQVICRSLGYNTTYAHYMYQDFGAGAGPIWLESLKCEGSEIWLSDCVHDGWGQHNCEHTEDVSVSCVKEPVIEAPISSTSTTSSPVNTTAPAHSNATLPILSPPDECVPITTPSYCRDYMPYSQTSMPNWLHQSSQVEANTLFRENDWAHLSDICSIDMLHFVCSLLTPKCHATENSTEIAMQKPCRSLCDRAYMQCWPKLEAFSIDWPVEWPCSVLPDAGTETCFDPLGGLEPTPTEPGVCEAITLPICNHGLSYNSTRLPNFLGHTTERQMDEYSTAWFTMLQTNCHPNVQDFVCALLTPECQPGDTTFLPQKPCRSVCEAVKASCRFLLVDSLWPQGADCELMPNDTVGCLMFDTEETVTPDGPSIEVETTVSVVPPSERCEDLEVQQCTQFYNTTVMPNALGHATQEEALQDMQLMDSMLRSGCSPYLQPFVCSVMYPPCQDSGQALPPCKTTCDEVRVGCAAELSALPDQISSILNCDNFPSEQPCFTPEIPSPGVETTTSEPTTSETTTQSTTTATTTTRSTTTIKTTTISTTVPKPACEEITQIPMCKKYYESTGFPNAFGQTSQDQVAREGQTFIGLLNVLETVKCHPHNTEFICAVLVPKCDASGIQQPCRQFCQGVKSGCEQLLGLLGRSWPTKLACDNFPQEACYDPDNNKK